MSSHIFIEVGYFVLYLYCIYCGVDVFFWVTFRYDNLDVWYFFGRWYRSCVFVLYGMMCVSMMFL